MAWRQRALSGVAQHWVIAIDDAHRLDALALARIGELREQAQAAGLPVGMLLVGRPNLHETAASPQLKLFTSQGTTRCQLPPCTYAETRQFIQHWLRVHGAPGREGSEPFLPEQALPIEQAFAAYTSGSARVNHLDETGTLAPGMLADLAVLDRDPFLGEPGEIGAATVVATYVDGVRVFG